MEICTPRPPSHHRGTCHLGEHCERIRGSSEASERVPYTHSVRSGGTEQAAPCRRRRDPLEDAASTPQQSNRHPPRKLRKQRGTIDVQYSTSTREQEEGFAEPPSPSPPRPARTGDPHEDGSAFTSLAATAGQGEHQAADLATTGKLAPRHLIEGRCRQGQPDRDPPRIWGGRPPTTDCLVLCQSTRELSAPITSSLVRSHEPRQANRPPQPARHSRTSAAASTTRGTKPLLRRTIELGPAGAPTTDARGGTSQHRPALDLGRDPSLPLGNTAETPGKLNYIYQTYSGASPSATSGRHRRRRGSGSGQDLTGFSGYCSRRGERGSGSVQRPMFKFSGIHWVRVSISYFLDLRQRCCFLESQATFNTYYCFFKLNKRYRATSSA
jgi:hypothetical protein